MACVILPCLHYQACFVLVTSLIGILMSLVLLTALQQYLQVVHLGQSQDKLEVYETWPCTTKSELMVLPGLDMPMAMTKARHE